jgi:hypothetical protein
MFVNHVGKQQSITELGERQNSYKITDCIRPVQAVSIGEHCVRKVLTMTDFTTRTTRIRCGSIGHV